MFHTLVVDDSKAELDVILYLIKKFNLPLNPVTALDGEEALEYIKNHYIDLLITDIRMPFIDGLSLSKEALKLYPELKIIISSGYSDFTYAKTAISLGVEEYILKPIHPTEFVKIITCVVTSLEENKQKKDMDIIKLSYSRDQITMQLINGDLIPDSSGYLPTRIRSIMPMSGLFILLSTEENFIHLLPSLRLELKSLGNQIFERSVRCIQPSSEYLLLIVDDSIDKNKLSSDIPYKQLEQLTSLIRELYNIPIKIASSRLSAPEEIHNTYIRLIEQLQLEQSQSNDISIDFNLYKDPTSDTVSNKVQFVCKYIASHYREDLSRESLSKVAYVHPDYLSRIFKNETGINLNSYIKTYRLNQARRLLETTQQKINSISKAVGYHNCSYFIQLFTSEYGVSPERYRQQYADSQSREATYL